MKTWTSFSNLILKVVPEQNQRLLPQSYQPTLLTGHAFFFSLSIFLFTPPEAYFTDL